MINSFIISFKKLFVNGDAPTYRNVKPLILFLLTSVFFSVLHAQPGWRDTTFGISGVSITSPGNLNNWGNAIALQDDQKIIIGGSVQMSGGGSNFALIRHNYDGSLDASFGVNGVVTTSVESGSEGLALVIQNDGKILLGGGGNWFINLARYNTDGSLDMTFGTNGTVITDVPGYYSEKCTALSIQDDGKIVVGGYGSNGNDDVSHFMVLRYTASGVLDNTFGGGGITIGTIGIAHSMVVQNDGKVLLGGESDFKFALERYTANGLLDVGFGINGTVIEPIETSAQGKSLAVTADGKIILAGRSYQASGVSSFTTAQFMPNGVLDTSFGIGGIISTNVGVASSSGESVRLQSNGKIVVSGNANGGTNYSDFSIVRYTSDGNLDVGFGFGGRIISSIGNSYSLNNGIAIDADGKLVLVGYSYDGTKADIAVARYHGGDHLGTAELIAPNECSIAPNPFNVSTTIRWNQEVKDGDLILYTSFGEEVKSIKNVHGKEIEVYREELPNGVYFLTLMDKNSVISVNKLVINDEK